MQNCFIEYIMSQCRTQLIEISITDATRGEAYPSRVSVTLAGRANTNLLFVLCVRNGDIKAYNAQYQKGTFMKTCTINHKKESQIRQPIFIFGCTPICNRFEFKLVANGCIIAEINIYEDINTSKLEITGNNSEVSHLDVSLIPQMQAGAETYIHIRQDLLFQPLHPRSISVVFLATMWG